MFVKQQGRTEGVGAKGPCPQTMDKKVKLGCRVSHMDALAVAMAVTLNDHKTAHKHSSFAPFQAYDNTKSVQLQGGGLCPPEPLT